MENIKQSYQGFNSFKKTVQQQPVFHLFSLSAYFDTIDPAVSSYICFNSFLGVGKILAQLFQLPEGFNQRWRGLSSFSPSTPWKLSLVFTAPQNQGLSLSSVPVCSEVPVPSSTLPHVCSCSSVATSVIALWTSPLSTSQQNEIHISFGRSGLFPLQPSFAPNY